MDNYTKYSTGLQMQQFKRIDEISHYNFNYYIGLDGDLLFCKSDDDNTSEWWVVVGDRSIYLGETHCDDGEQLQRYETRNS